MYEHVFGVSEHSLLSETSSHRQHIRALLKHWCNFAYVCVDLTLLKTVLNNHYIYEVSLSNEYLRGFPDGFCS